MIVEADHLPVTTNISGRWHAGYNATVTKVPMLVDSMAQLVAETNVRNIVCLGSMT